jgi:CRP-like cAMP-binding protein
MCEKLFYILCGIVYNRLCNSFETFICQFFIFLQHILVHPKSALLAANPEKLVVMKFKANYCQACAAIAQKFIWTKNDRMFHNMPIVWAEMVASSKNKDFFRRAGVLSLPTVHFYDGSAGLVENFAIGPTKIPILKQKLQQFLYTRVDPETHQLRAWAPSATTTVPRKVREVRIGDELITREHLDYLRYELQFFQDIPDDEFDTMLSKAKLQTFLPGDVIIRQGRPGTTFYVIKSGTVEMLIKSRYEDPISTPPSYLGAVVNQLGKFDFFGERALTTQEPYAASVRVLEKTRCFAFNVEDIPASCILSKKRRATQTMVEQLTQRYILPADYVPNYPATEREESILELLVQFKRIRQAARCFEYVMNAKPLLGDIGEIARRSMLVSKLSKSQQQDFVDVFNMVDVNKSGTISLLEMRRFMESAGRQRSDDELIEMIRKANPMSDNRLGLGLTLSEYMGVMAEAEFYYLFTETFQELDRENTGYVRAGALAEVLHGVRDLISDDRKSIIDVEDEDVQVDYEQFAKMLLGAAL